MRRRAVKNNLKYRFFTGADLIVTDTYTGTEYDGGSSNTIYIPYSISIGHLYMSIRFKSGVVAGENVMYWINTFYNKESGGQIKPNEINTVYSEQAEDEWTSKRYIKHLFNIHVVPV